MKEIENYIERIQRLTFFDDDYMRIAVRRHPKLVSLFLGIILNKEVTIKEVKTQYDLKYLKGIKSTVFDIYAISNDKSQYVIEIQDEEKGADILRARYYSSALDVNYLKAGEDYNKLKDTYVIFICKDDYFKLKESIYYLDTMLYNKNNNKYYGPYLNNHIIYVNGECDNQNSDIGHLMHDFKNKSITGMYYELMSEVAIDLKQDKEGTKHMSKEFREVKEEGKAEGILQGKAEGILQGKAEGILQGKAEGIIQGKIEETIEAVKKVTSRFNIPLLEAVNILVDDETIKENVLSVLQKDA